MQDCVVIFEKSRVTFVIFKQLQALRGRAEYKYYLTQMIEALNPVLPDDTL